MWSSVEGIGLIIEKQKSPIALLSSCHKSRFTSPRGEISKKRTTWRLCFLPDTTISLEDCLDHIGKGVVIPKDPELEGHPLWSNKFQWLPCNVSLPDGKKAYIDSYVNNLHPTEHRALYPVLEELIIRAVPLWNLVTQMNYHDKHSMDNGAWTNTVKGYRPKTQPPPRPKEEDEDLWNKDYLEYENFVWNETWYAENRVMLQPRPKYEGLKYPKEILDDHSSFLKGKAKKL